MARATDNTKVQHLYWRAGFGAHIRNIKALGKKSISRIVDDIISDSMVYNPIEVVKWKDYFYFTSPDTPKEEKAKYKKLDREQMDLIRYEWVRRMGNEKSFLKEKMTLFWHDHFACSANRTPYVERQNNLFRKHALGNFGTLIKEVAIDPLMLKFLNGQGNQKSRPNENFARELLELFTMGIGNYTEADIREAARAFTGWRCNKQFEVVRIDKNFDSGKKTFLGKTGNFDGNDIIDIILEQKKTAYFISKKLYRYFVNERMNEKNVTELAEVFYNSGYDIKKLMEHMFKADWFYDDENMGTKIKSPTEYIAGIMRHLDLKFNSTDLVYDSMKVLGQKLFKPPNVAGWPVGRKWINTSSMVFRLNFPNSIMGREDYVRTVYKEEIDPETGEAMRTAVGKKTKKIKDVAAADWKCLADAVAFNNEAELLNQLEEYLLQVNLIPKTRNLILRESNESGRMDQLIDITLRLMAAPEYQLC